MAACHTKPDPVLSRVISFRILRTSLNEGHHIIGAVYPVYYLFNSLMVTLQVLHVIWFYYICRMVYSFVSKGQVGKTGWRSSVRSSLYFRCWLASVSSPFQLSIPELCLTFRGMRTLRCWRIACTRLAASRSACWEALRADPLPRSFPDRIV